VSEPVHVVHVQMSSEPLSLPYMTANLQPFLSA